MISDAEKLALLRASKDLTPLELIEAICEACKATFINSDIARKEREACAKLCEDISITGIFLDAISCNHTKNFCAHTIRARRQA